MDTIRIDHPTTCLIAHRGLSGIEVENTAAAFVAAGNRTYYGIETDVHRTSDPAPCFVISHDADLMRTAGVDVNIETSRWDDLQNIVLFDRNRETGRNDLRLPRLEDYLGICHCYGKHAVLELKSLLTPADATALLSLVKDCGCADAITYISFIPESLLAVRAVDPACDCQYLVYDMTDDMIPWLADHRIGIDIRETALTEVRVRALHEAGVTVNCWTVDDPARAEELIAWGVDLITTNILE